MKKFWKKKEKEVQEEPQKDIEKDVEKSSKKKSSKKNAPEMKEEYSLSKDVYNLVLKIMEVFALVGLLYVFVFGLFPNKDLSMSPAIQDGDMVIYYKLDKNYVVSDTIVVEYQGEKQVRRVVARAGDVVDITERGLEINGSLQQEDRIYEDTVLFEEGVEFPLTVGPGQVFVLGDARETAIDSRLYGAVDIDKTLGQVFCVLRRRGI